MLVILLVVDWVGDSGQIIQKKPKKVANDLFAHSRQWQNMKKKIFKKMRDNMFSEEMQMQNKYKDISKIKKKRKQI